MRLNNKEDYHKIRDSITMNNLRKIIESRNYTYTKVALDNGISLATINAYINSAVGDNKKIPSLPTLINLAEYFNCSIDYLLDKTDNPYVNEMEKDTDTELKQLFQNISSLDKDKRKLVDAYVKGLQNS